MHLVERTELDHPIAKVWPLIVTPEAFQLWNDKVVAMDAAERFILGQSFQTRYVMNDRAMRCLTTVTALEDGRLLELQHTNCVGDKILSDLLVCERITLTESGGRTVVVKDIKITNHAIPWYFMPLIWLLNRTGKPDGPDKLKELCEANL